MDATRKRRGRASSEVRGGLPPPAASNVGRTSPMVHGAVTLDPDICSQVVGALRLTAWQSEIVALLLRGHGDKQIAERLGLRVATIRTHLSRIFRKIGVHDRVELILSVFAIAQEVWNRDRHHQP